MITVELVDLPCYRSYCQAVKTGENELKTLPAVHYWTMRGVEDTTIESLPSQVSGDTATVDAVGAGDITATYLAQKRSNGSWTSRSSETS